MICQLRLMSAVVNMFIFPYSVWLLTMANVFEAKPLSVTVSENTIQF